MSRHYSGGRLVAIGCDKCSKLIAPSPDIAQSGWIKCGVRDTNGNTFEWDYCDTHAHIAECIGRSNK